MVEPINHFSSTFIVTEFDSNLSPTKWIRDSTVDTFVRKKKSFSNLLGNIVVTRTPCSNCCLYCETITSWFLADWLN